MRVATYTTSYFFLFLFHFFRYSSLHTFSFSSCFIFFGCLAFSFDSSHKKKENKIPYIRGVDAYCTFQEITTALGWF
ncbi:hypothetical protein BCR43DRAFT_130195 [Syncephalastrum racemosum]|uniref:Uncharacterized protein n=1 Tax=Syncephalastrum racemosum TaxID=13706 RepID=A0A1X2HL71_SYNRA|nr:hypothetical protein BCR43DRAFT_130195 [Syncephalastrum racemosum]